MKSVTVNKVEKPEDQPNDRPFDEAKMVEQEETIKFA